MEKKGNFWFKVGLISLQVYLEFLILFAYFHKFLTKKEESKMQVVEAKNVLKICRKISKLGISLIHFNLSDK